MPRIARDFCAKASSPPPVSHPHIVYIYGSEEIAGMPVIAMELLPGGTLKDRVEKGDRSRRLRRLMRSSRSSRDSKPLTQRVSSIATSSHPNCFVDADGTVKVGDFGLSIPTIAHDVTQLTATGTSSRRRRNSHRPSSCVANRLTCDRTSTRLGRRCTTCSQAGRHSTIAI